MVAESLVARYLASVSSRSGRAEDYQARSLRFPMCPQATRQPNADGKNIGQPGYLWRAHGKAGPVYSQERTTDP
jgi:hypothetical protein